MRRSLSFVALSVLLALPASALAPAERTASDEDVRLIVLVVLDQLIPEQLERLEPWLEGGIGRMLRRGERWLRATHAHGITQTGPGHSVFGTGMHPCHNGIVANGWWLPDGTNVYCCGDEDATLVSSTPPEVPERSSSARQLLVAGIADVLCEQVPGSKSIGISAKDRAAILATGQHPDWALWWDRGGRGFVSSSWYGEALPGWVGELNARWPEALGFEDRFVWESSLPGDLRTAGTAADDRAGESGMDGSRSFPHVSAPIDAAAPELLRRAFLAERVYRSTHADTLVMQLAAQAVRAMQLGADEEVDYLFLGLSSCDAVGHAFGPYSHEVTDVVLNADAGLGELFDQLDEEVGEGRWLAALSADHGVLPLPEWLAERGYDSRRVDASELTGAIDEIRTELVELHGEDFLLRRDARAILLDRAKMQAAGVDAAALRRDIAHLLEERVSWLAHAYTAEELSDADAREDPLAAVVARSWREGRSPDIHFVHDPWILTSATGTTHGSPYDYDRDVPLVFYGPGCEPGTHFEACATVDVMPTLLQRAGLSVPAQLDGKVLE
jgi:predicted AlkP superfamily pyrophosphatase or phosphodiesterase